MLIEQTLDKLNAMKLGAMADACRQQSQTDEAAALSFEERLGLLVDAEWTAREQRKLQRRLQTAKLRYPATLEAVDFTHPRRLNRQRVLTLGTCAWIAERHNLLLIGPPASARASSRAPSSNGRAVAASPRATSACRGCCTSWPSASTLIASQLPAGDWHAVIGDPNQADAICDRLLHDAHRIELKDRSMRWAHEAPKAPST